MLLWMLYVIVVGLFLSGAALAAEHAERLRRGSTRWVWAMGIIASLLVPAIMASVSIQLPQIPNFVTPAVSQRIVALRQITAKELSPSTYLGASARQFTARPSLDTLLKRAWFTASVAMLLALLFSAAYLFYRKRRWERGRIAGAPVYITEHAGPAVVGIFRPRIVIPRWVQRASLEVQGHVIAHEQAHLDAHDVGLFTGALFLLVCMPWNLPLWWQLRRLRCAIEVDCDARVLKAGHDTASYGETLIAVAERRSLYIGAVAGMSESKSFLEDRISIMVRKPARWWRMSAAALGCLSLALVAVAAEVGPPESTSAEATVAINMDSVVLDRYTGSYQLTPNAVLTITREGDKLFAQLTGQPKAEIFAKSEREFFYKIVDAQISFDSDTQGNTTGLLLHQNGANIPAPRINAVAAQQIAANLAARIQSQTPLPGSEAAARRLVVGVATGNPNYDEMSPALGEAVRKQLPKLQPWLADLGPIISAQFVGVGNQGWDVYTLKHEHGSSQLRIVLDTRGTITGALLSAGP
jgi:beta-lactamase regulating signal transducer with metallopeptidase domain